VILSTGKAVAWAREPQSYYILLLRTEVVNSRNHSKSSKIFCHCHITTDGCSQRSKAAALRELQVKISYLWT